ncbi:hypothetical protein NDU88_007525 [Pleurodeles waltl]|uniref:Uncharacterized protein n=1 Tax=Pleurodeles waltl TaxID=8319 RepID=A0AAV7PQI2_PLEWA|nr:hypothetical protein NDU88_007525 [Pleurodeles waltl]
MNDSGTRYSDSVSENACASPAMFRSHVLLSVYTQMSHLRALTCGALYSQKKGCRHHCRSLEAHAQFTQNRILSFPHFCYPTSWPHCELPYKAVQPALLSSWGLQRTAVRKQPDMAAAGNSP